MNVLGMWVNSKQQLGRECSYPCCLLPLLRVTHRAHDILGSGESRAVSEVTFVTFVTFSDTSNESSDKLSSESYSVLSFDIV